MKIAICDDDYTMQNEVKRLIVEYSVKSHIPVPEIMLFSSGEALLDYDDSFDITFLDVELSGISGIHTGKMLARRNKKIINIIFTSHEDYLDEAMHFHAFRFLSKPLEKQRFFRNYKDALQAYHTISDRTAIETKDGIFTVDSSDIVFIEARFKKVIITTTEAQYTSVQKMDYWERTLNKHCFFRTHRSFIVNLEHIDNFNHNTISIFHGKYTAYLTVRKYTEFKKTYLMYIECMR